MTAMTSIPTTIDLQARESHRVVRESLLLGLVALVTQLTVRYYWLKCGDGAGELPIEFRVIPFIPLSLCMAYLVFSPVLQQGLTAHDTWGRLPFMVAIVGICGLAVGLGRGNDLRYVSSDLYRFAMPWMALIYSIAVFQALLRNSQKRDVLLALDTLALLAALDGIVTYFLAASSEIRISTLFHVYAIGWGIFQSHRPRVLGGMAILIGLLGVIASGKRGNLVAVCMLTPLIAAYFARGRMLRHMASVGIMGIIVVFLLVPMLASRDSEIMVSLERTLTSLQRVQESGQSSSMDGRFAEVSNVLTFFQDEPMFLVTGAGFGAEVEMIHYSGVVSRNNMMHQVHIGWIAYLLRNGILGVVLLTLFWWKALVPLLPLPWRSLTPLHCICGCYIACHLVLTSKSQIMFEGIELPFVVGFSITAICSFKSGNNSKPRRARQHRLPRSHRYVRVPYLVGQRCDHS